MLLHEEGTHTPTAPAAWLFSAATRWTASPSGHLELQPSAAPGCGECAAVHVCLTPACFGKCRCTFTYLWGQLWPEGSTCELSTGTAEMPSGKLPGAEPPSCPVLQSGSSQPARQRPPDHGALHTVSVGHRAATAVGAHCAACPCFTHRDHNSSVLLFLSGSLLLITGF